MRQDDVDGQPDAPLSGQERYGRDGTPLSEGGKPFKKRKDADAARKLRPGTRVLTVKGGFVLADLTPAQLAAQAKAAARLRNPKTSPAGQPIPAHSFIASEGGMSRETMADMGFDKNVRVGNRTLFAGAGKGMTLEEGTLKLVEAGYLPEGASHTDFAELVAKSLKTPQYTPEGWERIGQAEQATRFEDHLASQEEVEDDPFGPIADFTEAELEDAGYTRADDQTQAEVRALLDLAEAQGIDTEGIRMDAAARTSAQPEQAYYEATKAALEAALASSEGDRSAPAGREGSAVEVTGQTDRNAQGQPADPVAPPTPTQTPASAGVSASGATKTEPRRRVADLRKRLAVLKALRACVGGS